MKGNNTYIKKARKLIECGFWVAGYGNFDITLHELAEILRLVEENNFSEVKKLYERLEAERL